MTLSNDISELIKKGHGDIERLRDIQDTIKHDNFITTENRKYVDSLVNEHLRPKPEQPQPKPQTETLTTPTPEIEPEIQIPQRPSVISQNAPRTSSGLSGKKIGIAVGILAVAIAVALVASSGEFILTEKPDVDKPNVISKNLPLDVVTDEQVYDRGDIVVVSGYMKDRVESANLFIQNEHKKTVWSEDVSVKKNGEFSTLLIVGGDEWLDGKYTLTVKVAKSGSPPLAAQSTFSYFNDGVS